MQANVANACVDILHRARNKHLRGADLTKPGELAQVMASFYKAPFRRRDGSSEEGLHSGRSCWKGLCQPSCSAIVFSGTGCLVWWDILAFLYEVAKAADPSNCQVRCAENCMCFSNVAWHGSSTSGDLSDTLQVSEYEFYSLDILEASVAERLPNVGFELGTYFVPFMCLPSISRGEFMGLGAVCMRTSSRTSRPWKLLFIMQV